MVKVRIELVQDYGPRKGQVLSGIVVDADYGSLLKAVQNKLQLKKKELELVTLCCVDFTGTHVLPKGDLTESLHNASRVVVYNSMPADVLRSHDCQSLPDATSQVKLTKKVQHAVDKLHLVPAGRGSLSARGRPNPETLLALQGHKGVTALVTLLRDGEGSGAAAMLGKACERLGLKWCHAPLAGPREMAMIGSGNAKLTPEDLESFSKVHQVTEWLQSGGENVVVHCAAGLHRTGSFLYILLRELGQLPADALEQIRLMRPETADEFTRLNFQSKAEGIFSLIGSRSQDGSSAPPSAVEVVEKRRLVDEYEPEEDDDENQEQEESAVE